MNSTAMLPASQYHRRYRPVLVDTSLAMYTLRYDAETIMNMVETGEIRWAWDVSIKAYRIRELRFWMGELLRPDVARQKSEDEVIQAVIGHPYEVRLSTITVCQMLLLRLPSVRELIISGELEGPMEDHRQFVMRDSLAAFLRRRLVH